MSGRLLFVIIMYSFHKIQTQALLQAKLTATQSVITMTDSVTLYCETPSSVTVSRCYFDIGSIVRVFSCQKTLTATELLQISNQRSPADVKVKCFYTVKYGDSDSPSPHSDTTSINIQTLLPPKLTVNPLVISETDLVTLDCQTPSSVHMLQCFIYTMKRKGTENIGDSSCLRTVTGTELLLKTSQSSPAEVKVKCFYTVSGSPSPHSDTSTITIRNSNQTTQDQKPQMTLQHFPDIEETESREDKTQPASTKTTDIVDVTSTITTGQTFGNTDRSISTSQKPVTPTSVKTCTKLAGTGDSSTVDQTLHVHGTDPTRNPPSAETWMWKLAAVVGFGVAVGVISVGLVLLCIRATERRSYKRTPANVTDDSTPIKNLDHGGLLPAGNGQVYNVITSVPGADRPTGSKKMNVQEHRNEDSDVYHLYSTMSDGPPPSALMDMMYSTVQLH
ncbi:uncharacterized protein LOC115582847 [Sparus aurata]|uniref:uncharacterized protein LOC115582847 n=1 Tax=Sparus aurata TaxID=8175 RepID=UPI0011C13C5F|nr:uncharacterized protein LOC115582847 [Sparus aurata]